MSRPRGRPRGELNERPELAVRIDQVLAKTGLTNEEIARRLDPPGTAGMISHWRLGRHQPDWSMLQQIARLAQVSDYWLLTGRDDPAAALQAFEDARWYWTEAVRRGEDPVAAWEEIIGTPLSERERALLSGEALDPGRFVVSLDGEEWIDLTAREHRLLRELIALFQQRRAD